ncbi:hypothetical protein ESB00_14275 [Oleiharenicola lentus]|uniref:PEP-CTERM sorting domain-containing protein n=1 Tax=Oleiharenicola lentus TaxID=2508720 RepID=A0A4Q1C3R3_9BACT|nr:hypothetical protein [Oleiharenicola lentus]RXK52875.1 hypothetical protein ESB00_14275 [Oleiharenicola lentus]
MNIRALLKTVGLALALTGVAQASDLTWTSQFSGSPLKFLNFNNVSAGSHYYSNTFDITPSGFNPLTMTIDSAVASFAFADDGDSYEEWVDITLAGNLFINEEVDGAHPSSSYAWYSDSLGVTLLADLQADGKLAFKVQLLDTVRYNKEDTYLKVAKLVAKGHENPPHKVPDESNTVILMGAAMLSLIALRKRFARRA